VEQPAVICCDENDKESDISDMRLSGVVAATLLVFAASCSNQPAGAAPPSFAVPTSAAPPPSAAQTPAQDEELGPHIELPGGLLLKQLGKVAYVTGAAGDPASTFRYRIIVDSIMVDPKCDPYFPAPPRGHRLLVAVRVETSDLYSPATDGDLQFDRWSTIGSDGVSEGSANSGSPCRAATELPFDLRPAAKYRGQITVDTMKPAGELVLGNTFVWKYPAT
jgi:hypothetical protein